MNIIASIITTLSVDEKKKFVLKLRQKNKRSDTKNIELFQLLSSEFQQKDLDVQLYGGVNKGAYHALSKRLHDSLIDFIATRSFEREASEEMDVMKLLLASRIFFQHQQMQIAFKTLAKAELKAKKHSLYSILNEVYHTQIMNAHFNESIDLDALIKKFHKNKLDLEAEEKLNLFYATIHNELSENHKQATEIINKNLELYAISVDENLTYHSLFKILQISNKVANITRDYFAITEFVEQACEVIEVSERIDDKHLHDHIQILYYLANTQFRIKNFEASSKYLNRMKSYLGLQNAKYFAVFYPQYSLVKNLLLMYTGSANQTIDNLNKFDFELYKKQQVYLLDLKLTLVVALFLKEKFSEAIKVYRDFYHSDKYYSKRMGDIWVIKKNLMEILVFIELDRLDLIESRLNSFRKKHRVHLIDHNESRVLEFLKLVSIYYFKMEDIYTDEYNQRVDLLLKNKSKEEDVFTISFYAWLKSKIEKKGIYETCLHYIEES